MPSDRSRLYHQVLAGYVRQGVAPHYVDVAMSLGWRTDHARAVDMGLPSGSIPAPT